MIKNYTFKYKSNNKFIYKPSKECNKRANHIIKFFSKKRIFPDYFYHFQAGGHVAALHRHIDNNFYFRVDLKNFFYSIKRNRVKRVLSFYKFKNATEYAKWSCVVNPYCKSEYVLPIGFRQSPILASLVLLKSPISRLIEESISNDLFVSIYFDDFIGSSNDICLLVDFYNKFLNSVDGAGFVLNEDKLISPCKKIEAFNCCISDNNVNVSKSRITSFFSNHRSIKSIEAFNNYCQKIESLNFNLP